MKSITPFSVTATLAVLALLPLSCTTPPTATELGSQALRFDPAVHRGKLENGIQYLIRKNEKPDSRIELRLVIRAGSVLEEEDQQGLAHFVEHMAFNGTKQYTRSAMINYLESIGVNFGPDLNAYTSFDETVYKLQVPNDDPQNIARAFSILREWAQNIEFLDDEINSERGVVVEEWRRGRGASQRIRDQHYPQLFYNSRYAERLPIGKYDVLRRFRHDRLRAFYYDWYRPDLMSVIVVGDIPVKEAIALIKQNFAEIEKPTNPKPRKYYELPMHEETLISIATDEEQSSSSFSVYFKHDPTRMETEADFHRDIAQSFYLAMLNERFEELTLQSIPPILSGYNGKGQFNASRDYYVIGAATRHGEIGSGLKTVLLEAARAAKFGFTATEFRRQKLRSMRQMEQRYKNRGTTLSSSLTAQLVRSVTDDNISLAIEDSYNMYLRMIPQITLAEVNAAGQHWVRPQGRVIMINAPEKDEVEVPDEAAIRKILSEIDSAEITPYDDVALDQPLLASIPPAGSVTKVIAHKAVDVEEWVLSNGARVIVKETAFREDQVLMSAFSPGGHSLAPDSHFIPAASATALVREGGYGTFNPLDLKKKLAGRIASVSPYISDYAEGLSGGASPDDMESLMQLTYLAFTSPRFTETAYDAYQSKMNASLEFRQSRPDAFFKDRMQEIMSQDHIRRRPWTVDTLKAMDRKVSSKVYAERFADASDFTFVFVGNFNKQKLKTLVGQYLAALPSLNRNEKARDIGIIPPRGKIQKWIHKGSAKKSTVSINFHGPLKWTRKNRFELYMLTRVLNIRLRESLRENLGGTYGVSAYPSVESFPKGRYGVTIRFDCAPENAKRLASSALSECERLLDSVVADTYLTKVVEQERRRREVNLEDNSFWLGQLKSSFEHNEDPSEIMTFNSLLKNLNEKDIQDAARRYLDSDNRVIGILVPDGFEE